MTFAQPTFVFLICSQLCCKSVFSSVATRNKAFSFMKNKVRATIEATARLYARL